MPLIPFLFLPREINDGNRMNASRKAGFQIVAACFFGMMATFAGHTYGWAFFLPHIMRELSVSRTVVASLWGLSLFFTSPLLILGGRFLHRFKQLKTYSMAGLLFVIFVANASTINSTIGLCLSMFIMRFLGPGMIVLSMTTSIAKWFKHRRGTATLMVVTTCYFSIIMQSVVHALIVAFGWRDAYLVLAGVLLVFLCVGAVFLRDGPCEYGLDMDWGETLSQRVAGGEESPEPLNLESAAAVEREDLMKDGRPQLSYSDTKKQTLFWACIFSQSANELSWCGTQFYMVDILMRSGARLDAGQVATVQTVGSLGALVVALVVGLTIDKLSRQGTIFVLGGSQILTIVALLCLYFGTSLGTMIIFTFCFGGMMGINDLITGIIYANAFGKKEISKKLALQSTIGHLFVGISPFLCGAIFDLTGHYDVVIILFFFYNVFALAVLVIATLTERRPSPTCHDIASVHTHQHQ